MDERLVVAIDVSGAGRARKAADGGRMEMDGDGRRCQFEPGSLECLECAGYITER